jgi:signal transduction histidine kinase
VAGVALALYAVAGGLIPPAAPFFPANWLNAGTFEAALGIPPLVVSAVIGVALAVPVIRALEVFDLEVQRLIENMEQAELLAAERNRIARELHDGAIQTVYTAGLLVESAHKQSPPGGPVAARLERAMGVLNDAIAALRRNLVELAPAPTSEPLAGALRRLAADPRYRSLVEITFQSDLPEDGSLSPARTGHVLAVATEALANVVRHASARRAHLAATLQAGRLRLAITDDGSGLEGEPGAGFGLRNMRDRARLLGGSLTVSDAPGGGTRVHLDVPWEEERG